MDSPKKTVSLVTLNYNGKQFLAPLLDSLLKQTYSHIQIVMVDNASSDGSVEFLKEHYPQITLVENTKNTGFTGGNNGAIAHCTGEYIGLINNDMIADENYVESLVQAIESEKADVVGGKILFYRPFVTLKFSMKNFSPSDFGGSDGRALGCKVDTAIGFDDVEYQKRIFLENTFGEEESDGRSFRWVSDGAVVKIPVEKKMDRYLLRLSLAVSDRQKEERVRIQLGDTEIFSESVPSTFTEYTIEVDPALVQAQQCDVINNASSEIDEQTGSGRDIGMNEDDLGQYDTPKFVSSICGGSMLMKRELVEEYGLFDEYFFAYYEDADFCWRLKQAGKKLYFEPRAQVYHIHTGTSKEWSPFFRYHVERNRLAMLLKRGTWNVIFREWVVYFGKTTKEVLRLISAVIQRKPFPHSEVVRVQMRVVGSLLTHIPSFLIKRLQKK